LNAKIKMQAVRGRVDTTHGKCATVSQMQIVLLGQRAEEG